MAKSVQGTLYIVATPIGNLQDISERALLTLKNVTRIAAEDTRHTGLLLHHFNIETPMFSLHKHNEAERVKTLLTQIAAGESIALVSDAGTPLISDPGSHIVQSVLEAGYKVVPIPGPCALISALSISGFSADKFIFAGFLPAKQGARLKVLESLKFEINTMVFYEAPHRILATLEDMCSTFSGEREAVQMRELTKLYETVNRGDIKSLVAEVSADLNQQRGEHVIIVKGAAISKNILTQQAENTLKILLKELPVKQAVDLTAKISGVRRNEVYRQALELSSS